MNRIALIAFCSLASLTALADTVHLKSGSFDPLVGAVQPPAAWRATPLGLRTKGVYIVQSRDTKIQDKLASAGLEVLAYLPEHTFVVRGLGATVARLRNQGEILWGDRFHPAFKFTDELGTRTLQTPERLAERLAGQVRAVVHVFKGATAPSFRGVTVLHVDKIGPNTVFEVVGPLATVKALSRQESVQFVEESPEGTLRNQTTTWVLQSNVTDSRPLWSRGLLGQNETVGLIDGPMYMSHNCFRDPAGTPIGVNHRKVVGYFGSQGSDSHGTHTAGTIAGDREPVNGQTTNNGHAPKAKLAFTNLSVISGSNLYSRLVEAHNAGARTHSNSWGDDGTTAYTSWCVAIDQYSYDFEDSVVAFAVTNTSLLKTPENAKSCLAVGATNQAPSQGTVGSGGRGPTNDGRRKPEIFGPGIGIVSASSGTTDSFRSMSGTSMACPGITGQTALIRQWFREGRFAESPMATLGFEPSGALLRAMVMNAGVDMSPAGYPSNNEGWGRMLSDNVLWFPGENRRTKFRDVRRATGLITGEQKSFSVLVTDGNVPLRVTMSFTDFPAAVNASQARVNDMNLEVQAPNGTVYLGNDIDANTGQSKTGGASDDKNSTEMVLITAPAPGVWRITVKAQSVVQGGRQGYGVVANGNIHPLTIGG